MLEQVFLYFETGTGVGFGYPIQDRSETDFDQARVWFGRGLGQGQDSFGSGLSLIWNRLKESSVLGLA